jgi:pyruvate/2-oxoglutarate dehydrogenase complex dihydrolipoamide acyltransferase (E2) component
MNVTPFPRQRRHTLYFLGEITSCAPVFLGTEVDMSAVQRHRAAAREQGEARSVVTYLLYAAARVLAAHPAANAAIRGGPRPRIARYDRVNGKLTLDKELDGERVVLSAVLPDLHEASLAEIQRLVARYRDGDPANMPEFARTRALHGAPPLLGRALFRLGARSLRARPELLGTFSVTSLGHRAVDAFYSVGGTAITLGAGRIAERPVVRDGRVVAAPVMRLSLTFDHRVLDGAEAADVLTEIKDALEGFAAGPQDAAAPAGAVQAGAVQAGGGTG